MVALQHGDGRIEHDGGVDLALLHRRDRGGAQTDADDGGAGRIEAVLLQQKLQEEISRRTGRTDANLFAREILDRLDFIGMRGRHHQHEAGIAVIDHKGDQLLLPGGEIDAMIEVAGDHVGAAAEHGFQRIRAALEVDQADIEARLLELAELPGQHCRQIAEAGASADRDRDLACGLRQRRGQHQREQGAGKLADQVLHGGSSVQWAAT